MAASKTEPQTAVNLKTVHEVARNGSGDTNGVTVPVLEVRDPFAVLKALVERMVQDAHEEGRKAGINQGRVQGLTRALNLLAVAMSQLPVEDRCKLAKTLETVEYELTK